MNRYSHHIGAWMSGAAMLLGSGTALAQTAPTAEETRLATVAATAQMTAETEQLKARSEALKAQLDALGLPKNTGATTLKDDAGKLEGWMLATGAINSAAANITGKVATPASGKSVLLLNSTDKLDFGLGVAMPLEMKAIVAEADETLKKPCPSRVGGGGGGGMAMAIPLVPLIGAALSLLRSDTEIGGFAIDNAEAALVDAVAGQSGVTWVLPKELVVSDQNNEIVTAFDGVMDARKRLILCRDDLNEAATTDAKKKAAAPKIARLDASIARIDAYFTRITTVRDTGRNDLTTAVLASTLTSKHAGMLALRLTVEKAGGSLLKRSNLFTMLGAPAVGVTGGLVVSWRLFDPAEGTVQGAGLIVCRTALTNLNAIQKGTAGTPSCGWTSADAVPTKKGTN